MLSRKALYPTTSTTAFPPLVYPIATFTSFTTFPPFPPIRWFFAKSWCWLRASVFVEERSRLKITSSVCKDARTGAGKDSFAKFSPLRCHPFDLPSHLMPLLIFCSIWCHCSDLLSSQISFLFSFSHLLIFPLRCHSNKQVLVASVDIWSQQQLNLYKLLL